MNYRTDQVLMNAGFKWVVWIHSHKVLWYVATNNCVTTQLQLILVAVRRIHYLRAEIFYWFLKREGHVLPWTMAKGFSTFILKYIFDQTYPSHMDLSRDVVWIICDFSCRRRPAETVLANICEAKISKTNWRSKQIQCIFIGRNNTVCIFADMISLFPPLCWGHGWLASEEME